MKKIKVVGFLFLLGSMASTVSAYSLTDAADKVPEKVKAAFASKFPNAKKVKWEMEDHQEWEAEFKLKGEEYSANFLDDGTWTETEHEIKKSQLPSVVKNAILVSFPKYKMEEIEMIETTKGKSFGFELEKGEENLEVTVDYSGNIISRESATEEDYCFHNYLVGCITKRLEFF